VLSKCNGNEVEAMSNDHKPNAEDEERRITEAGGKVYQTQTPCKNVNLFQITNGNYSNLNFNPDQMILGPSRVFPGRLSVSRTFGDAEAKIEKFGGMSDVVIAVPEITQFKISDDCDFLILGCDGIFDQLSNEDVSQCVWMTTREGYKTKNIHTQCAQGVDMILKSSLQRKTLDNITCVVIAFENFEKIFNPEVTVTQRNSPLKIKNENIQSTIIEEINMKQPLTTRNNVSTKFTEEQKEMYSKVDNYINPKGPTLNNLVSPMHQGKDFLRKIQNKKIIYPELKKGNTNTSNTSTSIISGNKSVVVGYFNNKLKLKDIDAGIIKQEI
jgi:serine/threonine protein phosphatase PrpC